MEPQDGSPGTLGSEEFRQLRATVRERGSLRVVLFVATLAVWAVVTGLMAAFISLPLASLLPLILLMSGFEAVHQLHIGIERIGRYLYVRYESGGGTRAGGATHAGGGPVETVAHARAAALSQPMWESAIAAFGAGHRPSTRPADALFALPFTAAIIVNFLAALLGATSAEIAGIGVIHAFAALRVWTARRAAGHQRAEDQKRFEDVLK